SPGRRQSPLFMGQPLAACRRAEFHPGGQPLPTCRGSNNLHCGVGASASSAFILIRKGFFPCGGGLLSARLLPPGCSHALVMSTPLAFPPPACKRVSLAGCFWLLAALFVSGGAA